jgi:hypothetical protein
VSVYIRVCLSHATCIPNCIILFGLNAALLRVALFERSIGSSHGRAYLLRHSVALSGVLRRNWRTILFRRSLFFLWYRHSERVFKGLPGGASGGLRLRCGAGYQFSNDEPTQSLTRIYGSRCLAPLHNTNSNPLFKGLPGGAPLGWGETKPPI